MKKIYNIRYVQTAIYDLEEILDYLRDKTQTYANKFIDVLEKHISILKEFPFMGKCYDNVKLKNEYRVISIEQYLVFYIIIDDYVEIHRIIHCKRNYKRFI